MQRTESLIVILLVGWCISANARSIRILGNVFDKNNQAIESVNVYLPEFSCGDITDQNGTFNLLCSSVTKDTLSVVFSLTSYQTEIKKVVLHNSDTVKMTVFLNEDAVMLKEYEIAEYRKQNNSIELLDVSKLKTMPNASGGGIETIISTQAGVSMNNELSSQYSVRGGNYDENSVYVNSIEVYRPLLIRSGEQEGLSFVNPDLVESVSFSSGGFGVSYGDKMASVLDIKYKKPSLFEGSASVSLLGASAYVGTSTQKFSQIHGVRYKTSSYMLGSLETEGEYDPRFLDYQTYLTYQMNKKWEVSFLGNISRNDYRFSPESRETSFGTMNEVKSFTVYFDGQEEDLFMTYFGALSLKYKPVENVDCALIFSSFHTSENVSYDIEGSYWLSEVGGTGISSVDAASGIGNYHEHARNKLGATVLSLTQIGSFQLHQNELNWGITYQRELIDDNINEWELRDSAGYSLPVKENYLSLYNNLNSENNIYSNRISTYLQDTYTKHGYSGKWIFTGGARFSYWSFNEELLISPRVSITWFPKANSNLGLRLATGLYYQSLFYKEIRKKETDSDGNTNLTLNTEIESPRSSQLLIAGDYYFKKWKRPFKFSTELYYKYIDKIIPYVVDNTQIIYSGENNGCGYAAGIDFKLFGEFVPKTDSWISFSLMQTKEDVYGDGQGYIARPTDQRYNISLFFQDYFPSYENLKFNLKLIWSDGLPFGPPNNDKYKSVFRTSDYRRVDLGITYQMLKGENLLMKKKFLSWAKTVSFNLDIFNLLDINNVNSYYWVTDVTGEQYAVPNYLTSRRINFKIQVDF